jgi:hypothetical protein
MVNNKEINEIKIETDDEEQEEEISDEEFEQFIQQRGFSENHGSGERAAPVLEDSGQSQRENLEESLEDVETRKSREQQKKDNNPFQRGYGDSQSSSNYETQKYSSENYSNISETRKLEIGSGLVNNFIENDDRAVNLGRFNQQQSNPMGRQDDVRKYLEIKQAQALEDRSIPFERTTRKKERILK